MSEIVTTDVGRFRRVTDQQWIGEVSVDHASPEVVERLKAESRGAVENAKDGQNIEFVDPTSAWQHMADLFSEAAALIEAQRLEIAELRAALEPFAPKEEMDFDAEQAVVLYWVSKGTTYMIPAFTWGDMYRAGALALPKER
jgi:acyl-CoA reductase-like NAD-dependent aldehyde dehydrogenase